MAIFTRREIQRCLDAADEFLIEEQAENLAKRLNLGERSALDAEWELMWLTALARVGRVQHEIGFPGASRRADIYFQASTVEFVADVAAVSDAGYEKDNPIEALQEELERLSAKYKVPGGFALHVQSRIEGSKRDRRVKLALPPRAEMRDFVRKAFTPFFAAVAEKPDSKSEHYAPVTGGGSIQLRYDPKRQAGIRETGHLSFVQPYSLRRNPICNVLKQKKRQLAAVGYNGLRGVVLCDSGCSILTSRMNVASGYTLDQIVWEFLRQNSSIDFVITIGVTSTFHPSARPPTQLSFNPNLYCQPALKESSKKMIADIFDAALAKMPKPSCTPLTAMVLLRGGSPPKALRQDFFGYFDTSMSFSMKRNQFERTEIKLPTRLLTGFLTGEVRFEEYKAVVSTRFGDKLSIIEQMSEAVKAGQSLEAISLESCPDQDDDRVVLRFGKPDGAASKFSPKAPKS